MGSSAIVFRNRSTADSGRPVRKARELHGNQGFHATSSRRTCCWKRTGRWSRQAVIARHLMELTRSMRTVRPDLPECVEWAVAAALAKSPHDRPASGAELLRRLSH